MKIALAYRRFGRGAAVPNYCLNLARGLSGSDETWLFTRQIEEPPDGAHVFRFPFAFRSKRIEYGPNTALNSALLRVHRGRHRYDVVHTQDGELVGGDVVTAHSLLRVVFRTFRHSDWRYVSWIPKSPLLWCEDWTYGARRYRRVIAASEKMRRALKAVYGIPESDVTLIPLGVDVDTFRPNASAREAFRRENGIAPDSVVLLHVSTDFERKGLSTIVEALGQLGPEVTLVVVGLGREPPFRDLAQKLGVRNRMIFLGYREHLESVYAAADVFVFPTQLDFFGYPVMEAMASGVPPIVAGDAGVAELIEDGRNGFALKDPTDPHELADRVGTALGSDRLAVAREARRTAERTSVTSMVRATREVYEGLLRR